MLECSHVRLLAYNCLLFQLTEEWLWKRSCQKELWAVTMNRTICLLRVLIVCNLILLQGGCSTIKGWFEHKPEPVEVMPEEDLYKQAKEKMDNGSYTRAIELFQALESRYPFGKYGPQVLLDLAYAYYKQGDPESSLAALDRFVKLYPDHKRLDYAYYLRGLVHTSQSIGFVERYFPLDLSKRDPTPLAQGYQDFVTLLERFPESEYAPKAERRKFALFNLMAMHELQVANYYFRRGAYIAAANRSQEIVRDFPRTHAIPFALKIMAKSYWLLEMDELAAKTEEVYELNFGESEPTLKKTPDNLLSWIFWLFRWD